MARNGSTSRQNAETYREYGIEPEGQRTDMSFGGGAYADSPSNKPKQRGDMIADLQAIQKKTGWY